MGISVQDIADMIDHSLLRPELTEAEVREGCRIARQSSCVSVCVKPADVRLSVEELAVDSFAENGLVTLQPLTGSPFRRRSSFARMASICPLVRANTLLPSMKIA